MEITIDKDKKHQQIADATIKVIWKAQDTAEHGITHFIYPCPRGKLFNIWDLKSSVEKTSNGTVLHCYNKSGWATFKIKVI